MGTLAFSDLKEELRAALGNRTDVSDSRLGRALNLAQGRLARQHDFDEMNVLSTSILNNTGQDNDRFLTLPLIREMYAITLIDGAQSRRLDGITAQRMDTYIPKPEYWARDWPSTYCLWGFTIEVYPLPLRNFPIRMRWSQWPAPLVNAIDLSQFLNKDDVIIEFGAAWILMTLGKEEDARKHEAMALELLGDSEEADRSHPDITPRPGVSPSSLVSGNPEYWRDPFNKG